MEALRRPRPPRETGREAFLQDQSDRGPPAMSDSVSDKVIKNSGCLPDKVRRACSERVGYFW